MLFDQNPGNSARQASILERSSQQEVEVETYYHNAADPNQHLPVLSDLPFYVVCEGY